MREHQLTQGSLNLLEQHPVKSFANQAEWKQHPFNEEQKDSFGSFTAKDMGLLR